MNFRPSENLTNGKAQIGKAKSEMVLPGLHNIHLFDGSMACSRIFSIWAGFRWYWKGSITCFNESSGESTSSSFLRFAKSRAYMARICLAENIGNAVWADHSGSLNENSMSLRTSPNMLMAMPPCAAAASPDSTRKVVNSQYPPKSALETIENTGVSTTANGKREA
jgi:hypothetical protein